MPDTAVTPVPVLSGTFGLYETPSGGFHLAYRIAGEDTDRHFEVPAFAVRAAMAHHNGDGSRAGMLKKMFSRQ